MLMLSGCDNECESGFVETDKNCLSRIVKISEGIKPIQEKIDEALNSPIQHQLTEISNQKLRIDEYTSNLSPYGELTVKIGSKSADVNILQNLLKAKGYLTGSVSGTFDTVTKDAVIKFQKASGLTPDGIAGPQTWSALTGKISEETDLRGIISRYSGGLIPEYVDFFGTRIPTIYLGIGIGSLIGFAIYKRMQKRGEFEAVIS